jgi:CRP-like cAMP-binding protein
VPETPTPSIDSIVRFLRGIPTLRDLESPALERLAERVQLRRYDNDAKLFDDEIPGPDQPLRVLIHGRASWSSRGDQEKQGARMLLPGSVIGLESVNDWARRQQHGEVWLAPDPPSIRSRALGPVWMLELGPERFEATFSSTSGARLLTRLVRQYPTSINSPAIVAKLREHDMFARVSSVSLYRMLERAPTRIFTDQNINGFMFEQQAKFVDDDDGIRQRSRGRALYFVLDGELQIPTDTGAESLAVGDLGGPNLFSRGGGVLDGAWTTGSGRAVVLYAWVLTEMIRSDPGFARKLGPLAHGKEVSP